MFVMVNIANFLSVVNNIPLMWHTYKKKRADDISLSFLWMRLISSIIWCVYCIYYKLWYIIISWATGLVSSTLILYYKYNPGNPMIELQEIST